MEAGKRQPDRTRSGSNGVSATVVTRMSAIALLLVGKYKTKNCCDSNHCCWSSLLCYSASKKGAKTKDGKHCTALVILPPYLEQWHDMRILICRDLSAKTVHMRMVARCRQKSQSCEEERCQKTICQGCTKWHQWHR